MKNIKCFIFARSGSRGLKNKNIKKFLKKPLIIYTIDLAKKIFNCSDIYVSTDCKTIKKIAKKLCINIIDRPKILASSSSNELLSWKHAISYLEEKNKKFDTFLSLPCTSPLRKKGDILKLIKFHNKNNADLSLFVSESKKNPYFNMLKIDKNSQLKKIFKKKNYFRRQDAPSIIDVTTLGYCAKVNYILKTNDIFSGIIKGIKINNERSIDIDNLFDFELAEILYKKLKL